MRAFLALVLLVLFTAGAAAQSCKSLRGQLAAAEAGKPNTRVIKAIERKARSHRCNQKRGRHQLCTQIEAQMRQAKAGGVNRARVRRIRSQISTHCTDNKSWNFARRGPRRSTKGDRDGNFFSRLFGGRGGRDEVETVGSKPRSGVERVSLDPQRARGTAGGGSSYNTLATRSRGRAKGSSRVGNVQTMCVRLCDGFYFPINNRSHSDNYFDELAMCVGRCPGADVSLYVHGNGQAVEQMRSTMTGESYVNLPTAFAYRKSLSASCSCANGTRIVRGGEAPPKMTLISAASDDNATSEEKDQARWTPYRAVYDGTGELIQPSRTLHGAVPVANSDAAKPNEVARLRPASAAATTPDDTTARDFDPGANTARPVGPQFFSRSVAAFAAEKAGDGPAHERVLTPRSIITVTPVREAPQGESAAILVNPPPTTGAEAEAEAASVDDIAPGTSAMAPPAAAGSGG
ncbi:MAG: hypothetical protein AcusKO_18530 [Acuticoccus sp.]